MLPRKSAKEKSRPQSPTSNISSRPFPLGYVGSPIVNDLEQLLNCAQILLAAADQTIIIASYGQIGSDLHALNLTNWIAMSYFLTLTSFQPLYGKMSDIFGRKGCLLFAYFVFGTGCLFCGLARNISELIGARVSRIDSSWLNNESANLPIHTRYFKESEAVV